MALIQGLSRIGDGSDDEIAGRRCLRIEVQCLCKNRYRKILLELANEAFAIR